jgi:hypothetical protein
MAVDDEGVGRLAVEAYLYGYPLVLMDATRQTMTAAPEPQEDTDKAPANQFLHKRAFPDHTFTEVVTPNADTFECLDRRPAAYTPPTGVAVDPDADTHTPPVEQVAGLDGPAFFGRLNQLLVANPPQPADAPALERFATLGIAPGAHSTSISNSSRPGRSRSPTGCPPRPAPSTCSCGCAGPSSQPWTAPGPHRR